MPEPRTVRRGTRAVAVALVGMGVLAACTGGNGGAKAAASDQASVLASVGDSTPAEQALAAAGGPAGVSYGTDGSLYVAVGSTVIRLAGKAGVTGTLASGSGAAAPHGVVTLPDNSFVTVENSQLVRILAGQPNAVVGGAKGAPRSLTAPVPAGGPAKTVRLTADATPIGELGDGSVVVADGDALWRLYNGKFTVLYHHAPVRVDGKAAPSVPATGSSISPTGTVYLMPTQDRADTLGDVQVVSPAGSVSALKLPSSVPGVKGSPAALTPLWLSTDGKDGVYVRARGGKGDYLLHVTGGTVQLVAAATRSGAADGCGASKPVAAAHFPCPLPTAVLNQPGLLVLVGGEPYVVGIKVPKPKS
jgi:hypothetical protein